MIECPATRQAAFEQGVLRLLVPLALDSHAALQGLAANALLHLAQTDDAAPSRAVELARGGALLPLLELCRSSDVPVRAAAVRALALLARDEHVRLVLARHLALDTLVPILQPRVAAADVEASLAALRAVTLLVGDAACVAATGLHDAANATSRKPGARAPRAPGAPQLTLPLSSR